MHVGVLVLNELLLKPLDFIVVAKIGISVERAITLNLLGHNTCAHAPVVIDVPLGCNATARIGRVVKVVFYEISIISLEEVDVTIVCNALLEASPESDLCPI